VVGWVPTLHLELAFAMGSLQWVMTLVVTGVGALALGYCAWYFPRDEPGLGSFAGSFVAFAGAMLGLVLADDLLLLYVVWELTTVFSYLLIGHDSAKRAGRAALMWAAAEAMDRDAPLLVVFAANYPGMTLGPGPGLLTPEPGALDAAEEGVVLGVSEALAAHPGLRVSGATEVTKPVQTLVDASTEAALLVVGTRAFGQTIGTLIGSVAFAVAAEARCP
jgi:nucleotide-binding universal stress UspA family protein